MSFDHNIYDELHSVKFERKFSFLTMKIVLFFNGTSRLFFLHRKRYMPNLYQYVFLVHFSISFVFVEIQFVRILPGCFVRWKAMGGIRQSR